MDRTWWAIGFLVLFSCSKGATGPEAGSGDLEPLGLDVRDAEVFDTALPLQLGEPCRQAFECESRFCYFPQAGCGMGVCSRCERDLGVPSDGSGPSPEYVCSCGRQSVNAFCVAEPWVSRGRCDAGVPD